MFLDNLRHSRQFQAFVAVGETKTGVKKHTFLVNLNNTRYKVCTKFSSYECKINDSFAYKISMQYK